MVAYVFSPDGKLLEVSGYASESALPLLAFEEKYPGCLIGVREQFINAPEDKITGAWDGADVVITVDPSWTPPPPPPNPLDELRALVTKNIACSPHDKRFLTQKAIGKQAITWIREHPQCTPEEAENHIMSLVLAALPGQPVIAKLYWEHNGVPQGLAMSYLHEAIKRGYTQPYVQAGLLADPVPITWKSLVTLVQVTPAEQLVTWLATL